MLETKNLIDKLKIISSKGFNIQEVFRSFLECSAIAIYNSFTRDPQLEKQYMSIVKKYGKDNMQLFAECFSYITQLMGQERRDYVGEIFAEIGGLDSNGKGQVFTPLTIASFMAKSTYTEDYITKKFKMKHIVSMLEPAAGSGVFLVATANVLKDEFDINYQECVYLEAWELDSSVFYGLYLQASLMGFSGKIINGNTLLMEKYKEWITPVGLINAPLINARFKKQERFDVIKSKLKNKNVSRVLGYFKNLADSESTYGTLRLKAIASGFKGKVRKGFKSKLLDYMKENKDKFFNEADFMYDVATLLK